MRWWRDSNSPSPAAAPAVTPDDGELTEHRG